MKKLLIVFFTFILPSTLCAHTIVNTVTKVTDGDSFHIANNGTDVVIRISDIDCPELKQPGGLEAKKITTKMLLGKVTEVITRGIDKYGRTLGKIITSNGKDMGVLLIQKGLAWPYPKTKNKLVLSQYKVATKNHVGIWAAPSPPEPPWEYRRRHKQSHKKKYNNKIKKRSTLYGDSVLDIPRDKDGTAVGDGGGGGWIFVNTEKKYNATKPLELAGDDAPVTNSFWDGSVYQVERWLDKNLKDPDSFDAIEWSKVFKTAIPKTPYGVRCKYRARNSFGGMNIYNQVFYMNKNGNVVTYMDL